MRGEGEEFAERLVKAIWEANGGYCQVDVSATRLTDMPYETYRLDRDDFERMIGKAEPNRDCNPDLSQPLENHHG